MIVPALLYFRSVQPHGPLRRALSVLCSVLWADLCVRRWPAHALAIRAVVALAAEADGLVLVLESRTATFAAQLCTLAFYTVPYGLAFYGVDVPLGRVATNSLAYLAALLGRAGALVAASPEETRLGAAVEGAGAFWLLVVLGL